MYPASFEYVRAESVEHALEAKADTGGRFLAGGHSLLPLMKLRLTTPEALIDIGRIDGMRGISSDDGSFVIGALTPHAMVAAHDADGFPTALTEAAAMIGDPQVRNRGTVGGNVAHADPASDLPTVFGALGASMVTASKTNGSMDSREIGAASFCTGLFETALSENELLTEIRLPAEPAGTGSAYAKLVNPASRYALIGACAVVALEDGSCTSATVAVGGLTPFSVVIEAVGSALVGQAVTEETARQAAGLAADVIGDDVIGDVYGSVEYRRRMLPVFITRAIVAAAARAA